MLPLSERKSVRCGWTSPAEPAWPPKPRAPAQRDQAGLRQQQRFVWCSPRSTASSRCWWRVDSIASPAMGPVSSRKGTHLQPFSLTSPTLPTMNAARTHYDVIIVGAGPAGIFAALELVRRDGASVCSSSSAAPTSPARLPGAQDRRLRRLRPLRHHLRLGRRRRLLRRQADPHHRGRRLARPVRAQRAAARADRLRRRHLARVRRPRRGPRRRHRRPRRSAARRCSTA